MIGYLTLGTNDISRAAAFYDAVLGEIGGKRWMEMDDFVAWRSEGPGAALSVIKPNDGNPATVGNGVMPAIAADSDDAVVRLYNKAIELGASDEGAPGPRGDGFFAAYFRDLDGNKIGVFFAKF